MKNAGDTDSGWRVDLVILALALAVRAIHLAGLLGDPLFDEPRMDPLYHDAWARRIAAGELTASLPFFRAPLYAYFLGAVYALSDGSILAARAVQLALGALVPLLVARIARRAFGPGAIGRRVAVGAGVVMALYPLALRFDGDLLLEGPFVVLVILALHLTLRALDRPTTLSWWWTGLVFGLAVITRPNILAFVVLLPLAIWLVRRRWRWQRGVAGGGSAPADAPGAGSEPASTPYARGALAPWREIVCLALGVVIPIIPVFAHNLAAGDPTPLATQGGVNFYIGNNPQSDGFTAVVPGTSANWWGGYNDAIAQARRARGRELKMSEVSDYWFGEGLRFIATRPFEALRLTARKLYLFWWGAEISNNEHVYFLRRYSVPLRSLLWYRVIHMPFGVLGPLALVGIGLAIRRRPRALPLVIFVLAYMTSVVLFFVCSRFRYPVTPVLALFAVYAVIEMVRDLRGAAGDWTVPGANRTRGAARRQRAGRWRRVAAPGTMLVALVVLLNADPYHLHPAVFGSQSLSFIDLGTHYIRDERYDEAVGALREAARLDPGHPGPHALMGYVYLQTGQYDLAETALRLATRGDPVLFREVVTRAQEDLGRVYLRTGRPEAAYAVFRAALGLRPDHVQAMLGAGVAARELGRTDEAILLFERVLELDPDSRPARQSLRELGVAADGDTARP